MKKFIILNYKISKVRPMYVTSIAISSSEVINAILTDEKIAEFYENDANYKILYLDREEGKEYIHDLIQDAQKKYNQAEIEKQKQGAFISKLILST